MLELLEILTPKEMGERLRLVRTAGLNMTQAQLSKEIQIPTLTLSKIERGENVISLQIFKLLAFYSQFISLDVLFSKKITLDNYNDLLKNKSVIDAVPKEKLILFYEHLRNEREKELDDIKSIIDLL